MKKRPSWWWFVVGGVVLLAGVVIGTLLIVRSVGSAIGTDGVFPADGQPHKLAVPAGKERMVFHEQGAPVPDCTFVDGQGRSLATRGVFGQTTVTTGGTTWVAFATIDRSPDGAVVATCNPGSQVRVGAPVTVKGLGGAIVGAMAAYLGLGGIGFLILLVTTILFITRRPGPAAPPGPAA